MSTMTFNIQICNRCGNAFEPSGEGMPRTSTMEQFRVYTNGGGSWPSEDGRDYCEPCTELIEDVLKPVETPVDERVYPEHLIEARRRHREVMDRLKAIDKSRSRPADHWT